jgi:hypothetical protein
MSETAFDPATAKCDSEVFAKGEVVTVIGNHPGSHKLEEWILKVRETSGQRVDWHFVAGRAVVKAIGDLAKVRAAMEAHPL